MRSRDVLRAGIATLLLLVAGCQPPLTGGGIVMFADNEPVQSGSIEFRDQTDRTTYAGKINRDGRFWLFDQDGAPGIPAGQYDVVVVQIVLTEDLALSDHTHGRTVPRKYADYFTSGLTATVEEGSAKPIRVILPE